MGVSLREPKFELAKAMTEGKGDLVLMDTLECKLWRQEHDGCSGCLSHSGCITATLILGVGVMSSIFFMSRGR